MKQQILNAFFAVLVMSVFAGIAAAQQARPVLGGYRDVSVEDAQVKKAADVAVGAEAKRSKKEISLMEIVKAEVKSAAGSGYRLCLKVSTEGAEGQDDAEVVVLATVFFDLKGNSKLLTWEASDCGQTEDGESPGAVGFVPNKTYKPISNNDPGAGFAADFAVKKQSTNSKAAVSLVAIVKAEDKELGLMERNFRLCMNVNANGKMSSAQAVVSMDQYSNLKLLSWAAAKC